jgi:transcriptional regulator with XRE-family HTH domain
MEIYTAGVIIKTLRKQHGFTQEKLAAGIMERSNLARVETGKQVISTHKLIMLFERLGYSMRKFFPYMLNHNEQEFYELRVKINNLIFQQKTNEARELIIQIENNPDYQEDLHKQFLLKSNAALLVIENKELQTAKMLLDEAIRYTVPNFNENLIHKYLLAKDDKEIIKLMADIYYYQKEYDKAIGLLYSLASNIRKNVMDANEKTLALTFVLFSLSDYLGLQKRYREALNVCNEAIKISHENAMFGLVPMLLLNKAYALYYLNERKEIKNLLLQAYYSHLAIGQVSNADIIREKAKIDFAIDLNIE